MKLSTRARFEDPRRRKGAVVGLPFRATGPAAADVEALALTSIKRLHYGSQDSNMLHCRTASPTATS
jgi:hypothetical protein